MRTYIAGTQIKMKGTFTDENGQLVDPSVVECELRCLKDPDNNPIILVTTRQSLGVWSALYTPTIKGQYQYRFAGTGAVIAAGEGRFAVNSSF